MDGRARIETDRSYEAGHRTTFGRGSILPPLVLIRLTDDSSQTLKVQDVAAGEHDVMWSASEPLALGKMSRTRPMPHIFFSPKRETVSDREAWVSLVDESTDL